jgi:hypothetical protein
MSLKFALILALALNATIGNAFQSFSRSLEQPLSSTGYSNPATSNDDNHTPSRENVTIAWSPPTSELILSNGEKTSVTYTFSSSRSLRNAMVEAAPAISRFIKIEPNTFSFIPSKQVQSVHISVSIPRGAALGLYAGSIYLRSQDDNLRDKAQLSIKVWKSFFDATAGISLKLPPFPQATQMLFRPGGPGRVPVLDFQIWDDGKQQFISIFGLGIYTNTPGVSLEQWFNTNIDINGDLRANATFQQETLLNGLVAMLRVGPLPDVFLDTVGPIEDGYVLSPLGDHVLSITQSQVAQVSDLGLDPSALFYDVLRTVRFF